MKRNFIIDAGFTLFHVKEVARLEDLGETSFDDHTISIRKGLEERVYKEVLWHEVMHLILELSGYGGHPEDTDSKTKFEVTNEEMATRITRSVMLILRLNPELGEYINACE